MMAGSMNVWGKAFVGLFCLLTLSSAWANKTPSEVTQMAEIVYREVILIKQAEGLSDPHREPGVQLGKVPMHVYGKSREVVEKLASIQATMGIPAVQVPSLPLRKITPSDVFEIVSLIHQETLKIKSAKQLTHKPEPVALRKGLTPSDAYEKIWELSLALDALVEGITPNDVYRRVVKLRDDVEMIAARKGVSLDVDRGKTLDGKKPLHVNLAGFKNLHLLVRIQRNLNITRARVSHFPSGTITPADVYDTVNTLEVELARIKLALGISDPGSLGPKVTDKTPAHVYQVMMQMQRDLEQLLAAG